MGERQYPEPAVGALVLNKRNELLLIKSGKWGGRYVIPGGHVELGETIEQAVKREVLEEVGLRVKVSAFLMLQEAIFPTEFQKKKHFIFLDYVCEALGDEIKIDEKEAQEAVWVSPKAALKLNLNSSTRRAVIEFIRGKTEVVE
ncbi:NUDIX domain-containing protein [Candidatus Micrarchaeota archaeon]|nr:NUDIX domain-containing protein [Candidatus Micrarchaeota archaeon]